jgi:hypothetical protein
MALKTSVLVPNPSRSDHSGLTRPFEPFNGFTPGLPINTGYIEAIRYLRWLFAALMLSEGSKV